MRTILLFCIGFFLLGLYSVSAQQVEIHHKCSVVSGKKISCDLRFANPWDAPGSPEKVEILWPDGKRESVQFNAYNPNENTTAWLLLFDRSKSLGAKSIEVIRDDFGKIISGLRSKEKLGIATFAEDFQLHTKVGAERGELVRILQEIKPVGKKTFIYKSSLEALDVLGGTFADRKALVIISDGISEDPENITNQDVIEKAQNLGVVIYGIGYSEKPDNDIYLNDLQQMAMRTQGPWQKEPLYNPDSRVLSPRLMQFFLDFMQNGGKAIFDHQHPGKDITAKIVATLDDGRQIASRVELPTVFVPAELGILGLPKEYEVLVIAIVAGFLVLLLLALLIWLLRRGRSSAAQEEEASEVSADELEKEETTEAVINTEALIGNPPENTEIVNAEDDDQPTKIISDGVQSKAVYAFLEQLGDQSKRIELNSTTMSVGRHKDNDIQFLSSTVHRRHATLHMNAEKAFVITDLSGDTGNGVAINGQRVSTARLESGDLIELGDIRLRFIES